MDTKTAIRITLETANMISTSYLGDLSNEEMMHRPTLGCNHIKWQMGHLIASETSMINSCMPGVMPELPDGFEAKYSKETATSDDAAAFDSKETLMQLYEKQRAGTLAALESIPVEDLNKESPESIRSYAPTIGTAFLMQETHWMMHAGQWAVIRRQLGRDPLF
ncbi:MAG: DinB family protein [Mariniblastus sp.]|nr:DinB family protein [Mariniblastus sp.]